MKTCRKCGVDKLDAEFAVRNKFSGSLQPWCRSCQSSYDGDRNKTGRGKATAKRAQLKKLYGITLELYQQLLKAQEACAPSVGSSRPTAATSMSITTTRPVRYAACSATPATKL